MTTTRNQPLVNHTFHGGRFVDHGIDLDVLDDVTRYKTLLVETAKELWRQRNPDRERLPKNFEDSLKLKFFEVKCNCATLPLCRQIIVDDQQTMFQQPDELDEAVKLVADTIEAANLDQTLPLKFPRRLISCFAEYGSTLAADEWIEQTPEGWTKSVRFDAISRSRLQRYTDNGYEDYIDVTGEVTMARVSRPRMTISLTDSREIEAGFRPEDEQTITSALKDHATAKIRVIGNGYFSGAGLLQRVNEISSITLLKDGAAPFDPLAKPIWEEFSDILSTVDPAEFAKLPSDGAEHHDRYLAQSSKTIK